VTTPSSPNVLVGGFRGGASIVRCRILYLLISVYIAIVL
jgi:hypothetical protein